MRATTPTRNNATAMRTHLTVCPALAKSPASRDAANSARVTPNLAAASVTKLRPTAPVSRATDAGGVFPAADWAGSEDPHPAKRSTLTCTARQCLVKHASKWGNQAQRRMLGRRGIEFHVLAFDPGLVITRIFYLERR